MAKGPKDREQATINLEQYSLEKEKKKKDKKEM